MTEEPSRPTPSSAPTSAQGREKTADEQSELDLGVISTGASDVDSALAPLEGLGERSVSEHPEVYEQVLGELSATMADHSGDPVAEPAEADSSDSTDSSAASNGG